MIRARDRVRISSKVDGGAFDGYTGRVFLVSDLLALVLLDRVALTPDGGRHYLFHAYDRELTRIGRHTAPGPIKEGA